MERDGFQMCVRSRPTTFSDKLDVESKAEGGAKKDISRFQS